MTDQLEPYRKMVRSMRFAPPDWRPERSYQELIQFTPDSIGVITAPIYEDLYKPVSSQTAIASPEYIASLIKDAVSKPTVFPSVPGHFENLGDRISRLALDSSASITLPASVATTPVTPPSELPLVENSLGAQLPVLEGNQSSLVDEATETTIPDSQEDTEPVSVTPDAVVEEIEDATATPVEASEPLSDTLETVSEEIEEPAEPLSVSSEAILDKAEALLTPSQEVGKFSEPVSTASEAVEEPTEALTSQPESEPISTASEAVEEPTEVLTSQVNAEEVLQAAEATPEAVLTPSDTPLVQPLASDSNLYDTEETPLTETASLDASELESLDSPVEPLTANLETEDHPLNLDESDASLTHESLAPNRLLCPSCDSTSIRKNGHQNGKQRYACKDCGRQFIDPQALSTGIINPTETQESAEKIKPKGFATQNRKGKAPRKGKRG